MESLHTLIHLLDTMVDAHLRLHDLAEEKRDLLIDGNTEGLQRLVYRESSCSDEIQRLEQARKQWVEEYMIQKGLASQSFTLEEVMQVLDDSSTKEALTNSAKQLRRLIQKISHLNESNQQLIQTSLSYIQFSIGLHVRKEPAVGYGPNAKNRYSNLLDAKA